MTDDELPRSDESTPVEAPIEGRAPLGSWPATYIVILLWAALVIVLLRWIATTYNQSLG